MCKNIVSAIAALLPLARSVSVWCGGSLIQIVPGLLRGDIRLLLRGALVGFSIDVIMVLTYFFVPTFYRDPRDGLCGLDMVSLAPGCMDTTHGERLATPMVAYVMHNTIAWVLHALILMRLMPNDQFRRRPLSTCCGVSGHLWRLFALCAGSMNVPPDHGLA